MWEDPYFVGDVIPTGFNADYYVLVINLIFFWISCLLVYFLGRRLYSPRGGLISLFGVLFSVGLWDQVMAVTGISILVCLILLIFFLWSFLESARLEGEAHALPKYFMPVSFGVGLTGGLIFLTEYSAGLVLGVFLGYAFFSYRGRDLLKIVLPVVIGFLLLATPWLARNVYWTGHPLGLAGQNLALRVGDSTAEPEYFRKAMTSAGPKISLRKIGNKGLKGIEENIRNHFWSGGSYLFAAFFLTGILYRFRNPVTNHLRWYMAISVIALLLFQPFLNSGESMRIPMFYLSPLVIILGAGFFLVMLESTGRRSFWEVTLSIIVLLLLHGMPLAHNLLEPRRVPFTFPPYVPSVLVRTRTMVTEKFFPGYGIMSDIPAGTAWYSQQAVWAQPEEYPDFVKVLIRQDIGALFLSPKVLNKPYFTQLLRADLDSGEKYRKNRYWGVVYGGLQERKIPRFFPLQVVQQLMLDMYVLLNPLAWKGG